MGRASAPGVALLAAGLFATLSLGFYFNWSVDSGSSAADRLLATPGHPGSSDGRRRHRVQVVVAVLSARANHEQRQAVRETWGDHAKQNANVKLDFVVGSEACDVPEKVLHNHYSCDEILPSDADTTAQVAVDGDLEFMLRDGNGNVAVSTPEALGIDFEFRQEAVITHLGVYDHHGDGLHSSISAAVFDAVLGKVIVNTTLDPGDNSEFRRHDSFLYKPVPNFAFPQGFLGSVVATGFNERDVALDVLRCPQSNNSPSLGSVSSLMRLRRQSRRGASGDILPPMVENVVECAPRFLAASFIFMRHPDRKWPVIGSAERQRMQRFLNRKIDRETEDLQAEHSAHGDIALVPVVDVYRNLPLKLLLYFKNLVEHTAFDYVLKTDDDCVVSLQTVLTALSGLGQLEKVWWGRFRRNWNLERFGKWQELDYSGQVYPPFACGVGNVMSSDLAAWLALNSEHLKVYQGEDVSLGVWLHAVGVREWDDERWYCSLDAYRENGSNMDFLAVPNMSAAEMKRLWRGKVHSEERGEL